MITAHTPPAWPMFTGTFLDADRLPPTVQLQSIKTTNYLSHTHPLQEDRLETDDRSMILVPGTVYTKATAQCVSSDLCPCQDTITVKPSFRLQQIHV